MPRALCQTPGYRCHSDRLSNSPPQCRSIGHLPVAPRPSECIPPDTTRYSAPHCRKYWGIRAPPLRRGYSQATGPARLNADTATRAEVFVHHRQPLVTFPHRSFPCWHRPIRTRTGSPSLQAQVSRPGHTGGHEHPQVEKYQAAWPWLNESNESFGWCACISSTSLASRAPSEN